MRLSCWKMFERLTDGFEVRILCDWLPTFQRGEWIEVKSPDGEQVTIAAVNESTMYSLRLQEIA